MIAPIELYLWVIGVAVPLFWALRGRTAVLRMPVLAAVSLLLLFAISPMIPAIVIGYLAAIAAVMTLRRRGVIGDLVARRSCWLAFAPLLLGEFVPAGWSVPAVFGDAIARSDTEVTLAYLALGFTAIRAFLVLRQALAAGRLDVEAATAALVFFGSFPAGPIAGSRPFTRDDRAPHLGLDAAVQAVCRIGWGSALVLIVAPYLRDHAPAVTAGPLAAWGHVYLQFLAVYLDFTGYSDVAIGTAALFGIRLPENFNFPLAARSIQDFWQRWHMSLANFIGTYLYKPLVRAHGRPALSILVVFVLVGLWHRLDAPYLLWGLGHGAALGATMVLRQRRPRLWQAVPDRLRAIAGWAMTLTYVALLSAIANTPSLAAAGALAAALVGR